MDILSFQSENPAEIDAFKGGSHDRVATAIHNYLLDDSNHKVIGLDGEFGSGKSSILQMLEKKIIDVDSATKLWLFDCEQNYQGSIKSNFIELLTEQVLKAIPSTAKASVRENVLRNRDIALGRHVSYTKDTRSHISIWAILLIAGGVLSPTLLRDYLSQLHQPDPLALWKHGLYTLGIIFPAITLGLAMFMNRGKGKKKWNLSSILKGSSDDHITETIEISKEVSPLDLKRTLDQHLEAVSGTNFIIVIDNLDRLPREALRAVWSDLEIFTSVSRKQNLSIIVPFCSTKVSKYLNGDNEKSYDSKDFIAKKFPVVFRAPPIITSGWKDAFRTLWTQSFGSLPFEQADVCSLILKRHSPMADGLVTPRLQKRFINDLATTVLVTAGDPKMEVIAAYISICKYNGVPIEILLRAAEKTTAEDEDDAGGKSEADDPVSSENLRKTRELLSGLYGEDVESGWPIQILQVHFQTSKDIAIAELIDQPLANAVESESGKKFVELSSYFGFMDSFSRFLEGQLPVKSLLQTLHLASGFEGFDASAFTRKVSVRLASDSSLKDIRGDASYYQAIKSLTHFGLNKDLFRAKIDSLASDFDRLHKTSYTTTASSLVEEMILTYDAYLDAVDQPFESRNISSSENLFHHLVGRKDLKVIDAAKISLDPTGIKDAVKQITATNALPYDMVPLDEESWESCFILYFGQLQLKNRDRDFLFSDTDVMSIITSLSTDIREDRYWLGLAFYKTYVPQIVSIINSYSGSTTSVRTKLAIASIYLRQGLYDELAGIVGIAEALEESPAFFEALVRATSVNDDLTFGCLDPVCAPFIAPLMARLIKSGGIGTVFSSAIHKNYKSLVDALQPYGLSEDEFFAWFVSYNLSPSNLPSFKDFDSLALERVLNSDHPKMVTLRDHLFEERFVNLDVQGWSDVIAQSSTLQTVALERMVELNWPLKNIKPAYDASLSYLTAAARQPIFIEPPIDQIETLNLVIRLLSDTQRTILGTELRELLYSTPCTSVAGIYLLATFGALIPTFVPVNEVESGRLLQLFSLIGTETPHTSEAACFLNSRHQQLISWAPGELMHTYMELVTKQKDVLPNVYENLSNKKGFKRRMKRLTDALFS